MTSDSLGKAKEEVSHSKLKTMKSPANHDTIVYRLAQILIKLNQGEKLDPQRLADDFHVSLRTIQRDLNVRFGYLPLQREGKRYSLDVAFLGKLSTRDVERFASLAGVKGLFPSLSDDFLRDIFDARMQSALLVKGHDYENLSGKEEQFRKLEEAIIARRCIAFDYTKESSDKHYPSVEPCRLVNHKGIWYLAAKDGSKLKTFAFGKLSALHVLEAVFQHDPTIDQTLEDEDGIWLGDEKKEIVLKVAKEVAGYFKRRKLIANQVIEKELEDGGLIVSAKVGHPNQVLPIVRYWIPHLRIISPEGLQVEMEFELQTYISRSN